MRRRSLCVVVAACALALARGAGAAPADWDVTGSWTSFVGDLRLTQAGDGALTGSFQMKAGCTDAYTAAGRIEGNSISLTLVRANGGGDQLPCAGMQTLKGSVGSSGTTLNLALANFAQSSPPTPFSGQARKLGTEPAFSKSFAVFVKCGLGKQLCPRAFVAMIQPPAGTLAVRFTMSSGHCSDARVRISIDGGAERVSPFLGAGKATPEYDFQVKAGTHRIQVRAEGRRGGCNHGDLQQWAGTLQVRSTA